MTTPRFERLTLDDLTIEDDRSFRHIEVYGDLKEILRRDRYSFRVLPEGGGSWDRALFLNLTFWGANEGGDVLVDKTVPADVVAHVAWHHLAAKAFGAPAGLAPDGARLRAGPGEARPSVDALFLGEAIASAFDLYLVGRLLGRAPESTFLATQVPAMAEAAEGAGVDEEEFETLLRGVAEDPEAAFQSLCTMLYDASRALYACKNAEAALAVVTDLEPHRFGPLLHRYELANWILYARAYGDPAPSSNVAAVHADLQKADDPLTWLVRAWVDPALKA